MSEENRVPLKDVIANIHRQRILDKFSEIMKRLEGGFIYGVPIQEDDLEALVVAAYFAGQADVQKEHAGRLQLPPL